MNKISSILIKGVIFMSIAAAASSDTNALKLETYNQKLSYAIGLNIGAYLQQFEGDSKIDTDIFFSAIKDRQTGAKLVLNEEQYMAVMKEFQDKQKAQTAGDSEIAEKNLTEGQEFLTKNLKNKGITETSSGLQYEVITKGTGPKPKASDSVKVHYQGSLIDGTVFDSSYKRGEPTEFPLNGVIRGWTEGLQLMNAGSKYRFFIPAKLAYGETGAGRLIGPNKALIFEVELLEIKK